MPLSYHPVSLSCFIAAGTRRRLVFNPSQLQPGQRSVARGVPAAPTLDKRRAEDMSVPAPGITRKTRADQLAIHRRMTLAAKPRPSAHAARTGFDSPESKGYGQIGRWDEASWCQPTGGCDVYIIRSAGIATGFGLPAGDTVELSDQIAPIPVICGAWAEPPRRRPDRSRSAPMSGRMPSTGGPDSGAVWSTNAGRRISSRA